MLLDEGVPPLGLVHDLQNHDEITYQLVELKEREDETFTVNGKKTTGKASRWGAPREMRERLAGDAISYTMLYRPEKDGLATTFPGSSPPVLGSGTRTVPPRSKSRRFARRTCSCGRERDAAGRLQPVELGPGRGAAGPEGSGEEMGSDGDHRWINRGAVDLMGANPDARRIGHRPAAGKALYGSLPEQLKDRSRSPRN